MIRVAVADRLPDAGTSVALDDTERHHLRVRRVGAGARVEVLDGRGGVGSGRLIEGHVALDEVRRVPAPPPLVLLVGAGDRDRLANLVEKAQEVGVTHLVPVVTERAAHVATRVRGSHVGKLVRRAVEAMKQSGAEWQTSISAPMALGEALAEVATPHRWLADSGGGRPPLVGPAEGATVLVGPEGGLTPEEREAALAAGFRPVRLGPHVLRFETAAIVAAALITVTREGP